MQRLPKTITFYLPVEYAKKLDRVSKYQGVSPQEKCKQKVIAWIDTLKDS